MNQPHELGFVSASVSRRDGNLDDAAFVAHEFLALCRQDLPAHARGDGILPSNGHGALRRIDDYRGCENSAAARHPDLPRSRVFSHPVKPCNSHCALHRAVPLDDRGTWSRSGYCRRQSSSRYVRRSRCPTASRAGFVEAGDPN